MSAGIVSEPDDEETTKDHPNKKKMDPLVQIMMNPEIIKLTSTVIAKLEAVRYDETRRGVFRTPWVNNLFGSCVKRLGLEDFNIDRWYSTVLAQNPQASQQADYRFSPALVSQDVDTNWLLPLFELEMKIPGFVMLLHNTLDLEDSVHDKIVNRSKKEEYDFLGVGKRNKATGMIAAAPARGPGLLTGSFSGSK
jgi:hypothetical protein